MLQILFAVLVAAAYTDLRYERIPNLLITASLTLSCIFSLFCGGARSVPAYLLSVLLPFLFLFPFWLVSDGGLSAGDIKLFMTVSSFLGFRRFLHCFICTFVIAAVPAVILLFFSRSGKGRIRLALPILLGTVAGLFLEQTGLF